MLLNILTLEEEKYNWCFDMVIWIQVFFSSFATC